MPARIDNQRQKYRTARMLNCWEVAQGDERKQTRRAKFITRLGKRYTSGMRLAPQPTLDEMRRELMDIFFPHLVEARVASAFALLADYATFLTVAPAGWSDAANWTML